MRFVILCINHFSDITIEVFLFMVGFRWFKAPADRRRTEILFLAGLAGFIAEGINVSGIRWMSHLLPFRYDLYVYNLDVAWGAPGFAIGRFLDSHIVLKMIVVAVYNNTAMFMLLAFIANLYLRGLAEAKRTFVAFVVNPIMAIALYVAFPVSGPIYAFGAQFPNKLPPVGAPHPMLLDAVPNGVPSVHISIALLVLWFLWEWHWGRYTGIAFLFLTIIATLGLGEHYVLDLLCAVPYAAICFWLTEPVSLQVQDVGEVHRPVTI